MRLGPLDPEFDWWHLLIRWVMPHDRSLSEIQGLPTPDPIQAWSPVLSDVLLAMSSVAVTLGVLYFLFQVVQVTIHAGWSGEAISREWHSIWGPARLALGMAMITPIANGMSLVQMGVLQISSWSGQLGNHIHRLAVTRLASLSETARPLYGEAELAMRLRGVVLADLCARSWNYHDLRPMTMRDSGALTNLRALLETERVMRVTMQDGSAVLSGIKLRTRTGAAISECPVVRVSWSGRQDAPDAENAVARNARSLSLLPQFGLPPEQHARLLDLWRAALEDIARDWEPIGRRLLRGTLGAAAFAGEEGTPAGRPDIEADFRAWEAAALARWRAATLQTIALVREAPRASGTNIEETIRRGWLALPTLFWRAVSTMHDAWTVAQVVPDFEPNNIEERSRPRATEAVKFERYRRMVQALGGVLLQPAVAPATAGAASAAAAPTNPVPGAVTTRGWLLPFEFVPQIDLARGSAVLQMADWGFGLFQAGAVAWAGGTAVGWLSSVSSVVGAILGAMSGSAVGGPGAGTAAGAATGAVVGGLVGFAAVVAKIAGGVMVLAGLVFAYVLPSLPMVVMTLFAVGCLVLMVEAVIAAPIWAMAHMKLSGDRFLDQSHLPGYEILLSLFLRIPIAMAGFVFAVLVADVVIWLTTLLMSRSFGSHVFEHVSGNLSYVTVLAILIVMAALAWQASYRAFTMINELPDRVLRWIRIQSAAPTDDGQKYVTGMFVMGMQRTGAAMQAGTQALGAGLQQGGRRALPAPGVASRIPRPPGGGAS